MRLSHRIALGLLILLAIGFMFHQLRMDERQTAETGGSTHPFPRLPGIREIAVWNGDGSPARPVMTDSGTIDAILDGLGRAPQSHFDDPEMGGWLYRVEMRSADETFKFELNDVRGKGSNVSGKIYPINPGREDVWSLPSDLIGLLTGKTEPESKETPDLVIAKFPAEGYTPPLPVLNLVPPAG